MDFKEIFNKIEQIRVRQQNFNLAEDAKTNLKNIFVAQFPEADFALCNEDLYFKLLTYAKLLYAEEQNGVPEEHAYKLAVIFSDERKVINYLKEFLKTNPNCKQLMHDACLFALPQGEFDLSIWRKLSDKLMKEELFRNHILPQAVALEKLIKDTEPKDNRKKPTAAQIKEATDKVAQLKREVKDLRRHHRTLTPEQDIEFKKKSEEALLAREALTSMGMPFDEDLTLTALSAFKDKFVAGATVGFDIFLKNGLTKADYERFSALKRQDDDIKIPNIKIAGKGNAAGTYLMKIPVMDEAHAARAACLGKLTHCCQSLSKEAGQPCVIHGLTSVNGGFYVVCKGDVNNPKVSDKVLGQCWAWRSKNDAIVFDSVEVAGHADKYQVAEFYRTLAAELVNQGHTQKVVCGQGSSGISVTVGIEYRLRSTEAFVDYSGYCDSKSQLLLYANPLPFIGFNTSLDDPLVADAMVQSFMENSLPLSQSETFGKVLSFSLSNQRNDLLDRIKEFAKRHNREKEVELLIEGMQSHLKSFASLFPNPERILSNAISLIEKNQLFIETALLYGSTALLMALEAKKSDHVEKLIKMGANIHAINDSGNNALLAAIEANLPSVALSLIEKGIDIQANNVEGNTALILALKKGQLDVALKLIEKGADINMRNVEGESPLNIVIRKDLKEFALKLIEQGADVQAVDKNGVTEFMHAVEYNVNEFGQKMLEKGANINAQDSFGKTALIKAVLNKQDHVVLKLIELGADITIKDDSGNTALDWARRKDRDNVSQALTASLAIKEQNDIVKSLMQNFKAALLEAIPDKELIDSTSTRKSLLLSGEHKPEELKPKMTQEIKNARSLAELLAIWDKIKKINPEQTIDEALLKKVQEQNQPSRDDPKLKSG